ncbi:MAG: tRNA 2-thiouridine(34) synthase MnmA [Bdellovibrionales bacterium GWC1_52_8]|nr:MAG: tRNA 2-thiouridine(34) synthase MnmA [Bdellovibrionales bacterium GWC1_52_8]
MFWKSKNTEKKGRVFVGLSGGVDSAVSAALLQKDGYEVTGVFIRIALEGYPCTAGEDKLDAMRVAAHLRIQFLSVDLSEEYIKRVFEFSIAEFDRGRTPNPDALCNREIKFGLFFDWCMERGADFVATGHYAKIVQAKPVQKNSLVEAEPTRGLFSGQVLLEAGADKEKDQSYFLWAVPEEKLRRTLFPIGNLKKPEVRTLAKKLGLPNAGRKDSQGLCFLGPVSIDEMLHRELRLMPGDVLDESGAVIGRHAGAQAYTLGQRHGFELSLQKPDTRPHFVIAKDIARNTITVSTNKFPKDARETVVELSETNWIGPRSKATQGEKLAARYRYRQKLIHAELNADKNTVTLFEPHFVPEGQSLVLYDNDRCLGGGVILNTRYGDTSRKS